MYGQAIAVDGASNVYLGGYFLKCKPHDACAAEDWQLRTLLPSSSTRRAPRLGQGSFGGSGAYAYGQAIAVDGASNVYVGGRFSDANLTTPSLTKIGSMDAFAIKLDSTGAATWAKNVGGSGASAYGQAIALDGSGNAYLGGYFYSANLTTPALTKIGGMDAFAIKLDSTGAATWAKNVGGSGASVYGQAIAVDGSGNVYLGGYFQGANLTTPTLE